MNTLYILQYFGPVSLKGSIPELTDQEVTHASLFPPAEKWDCRCQGCWMPRRSTLCLGPHPKESPPAMASGTPEPSSAPSSWGGGWQLSSTGRRAHAPHATINDCYKPWCAWELSEGATTLPPDRTQCSLWWTLLAHELYDRGQADGTILPLCLVLMLARGLGSPQLGLATVQDHTASRHLRSPPPKPIRGWFSPSHTITRLID